jgi:hypothetical protein
MNRLFYSLVVALALPLEAQTARTWRGVNGDWFNPANWTPSGVPAAGDSILVTGGSISASQPIQLEGEMTWTGGTLASGVALTVSPSGVLVVQGPDTATLTGVITNAGLIRLRDTAVLRLYQSTTRLVNLPTGVIESQSDDTISHYYSGGSLENLGLFRKTGGTGETTFTGGVVSRHYGTMEVASGTVALTGGSGAAYAYGGSRFVGTGTVLVNGGILSLENVVLSGNLRVTGGSILGTGRLSGILRWLGGDLPAGQALTVLADGVLELSGSNTKTITGVVTNAGTLRIKDAGDLRLYQSTSRLVNLPGGVIESQSNHGITAFYSGGVLRNEGLFRKIGGDGNVAIAPGVVLENHGTVEVQQGGIVLATGGGGNCHAYAGSRFIGPGTNLIDGGTLTFHGAFQSENLLISSGLFAGDGTMSGFARWTGGAIGADAVTRIAADGVLEISGPSLKDVYGRLVNLGRVNVRNDAQMRLYSSASRMENLAGAVFDSQSDDTVTHYYSGGTFLNQGSFVKSAGTGTTTFGGSTLFNNEGRVQVLSGTLTLGGGVSTGRFEVAESATLALPAGHGIGGGAIINGLGTTKLTGGSFTLDGDLTTANILMQGGSMFGTNGVIHGTLQWTGGSIGEGATLTVAEDGRLRVVGPNLVELAGVLTNRGLITFESDALLRWYSSRSVLLNEPGGIVDSMSTDTLANYYTGGVFRNRGLFRKSGGTGMTTVNSGVVLENYGTIEAQMNAIALTGGGGGCHVYEGSRMIGAGTNLVNGGSITFHGLITCSNLEVAAGSLLGEGGFTGTARWVGGTINSAALITVAQGGRLDIVAGNVKDLVGTLVNEGTIVLKDTAWFRFYSASGRLLNRPGGLVDSQTDDVCTHFYTGGRFENQGVFRKSGGTGETSLSGGITFQNLGSVEVLSGSLSIGLGEGSGNFMAGSGTSLNMDGDYLAGAGSNLGGEGRIRFRSGSVTIDGAITCRNSVLEGATISGTNGVLCGSLDWTSGTIGNLRIATNGAIHVIGSATKDLTGTLVNQGTLELGPDASLRFYTGAARLRNEAGGLLHLRGAGSFYVYYSGGVIANAGVIRKSGENTTFGLSGGLSLVNTGTLEVHDGIFSMNAGALDSLQGRLGIGISGAARNGRFDLSGTLGVVRTLGATLLEGYEPEVGTRFTAMTLAAMPVGFTSRDLPRRYDWTVDTSQARVQLQVTGIRHPPSVVKPPQSQLAFTGQSVQFTVEVTGAEPISYQWRFEGADLVGETGSTLTLPQVQARQAGRYAVVVSNSVDTVVSGPAVLTIRDLSATVAQSGTGLKIEFPTLAGRLYRVEFSSDLKAGSWQPLGAEIHGDGTAQLVFEPGDRQTPYRFYRVIQLP